eukprot:gb/GECG01002933.1/.p1 GENE.gb/GECG01002933.1/~~gb/GECG01002933.1/.p1  ORF type:complete len:489 (+),score=47.53 gb/GECG01002933.1/:1-1467(+)
MMKQQGRKEGRNPAHSDATGSSVLSAVSDEHEHETGNGGYTTRKVHIPVQYLRCAMVANCAIYNTNPTSSPASSKGRRRAITPGSFSTSSPLRGGTRSSNDLWTPLKENIETPKSTERHSGPTPSTVRQRGSSSKHSGSHYNLHGDGPEAMISPVSSQSGFSSTLNERKISPEEERKLHRPIVWNAVLQTHEHVNQGDYEKVRNYVHHKVNEFRSEMDREFSHMNASDKLHISHDQLSPVLHRVRKKLLEPFTATKTSQLIDLDVNRSFHLDVANTWSPLYKAEMQFQLSLVCHIFFTVVHAEGLKIHYYQGLNDIASVLLVILGPTDAIFALSRLCADHLRGFTVETMSVTQRVNRFCLGLVRSQDRELYEHLSATEMEPIFAIPWFLTWFAHSVRELDAICELYDILLVSSPLFCAYLAASLILQNRRRILYLPADMGQFHVALQEAAGTMPHREMIVNAIKLYQACLPHSATLSPDASNETERAW